MRLASVLFLLATFVSVTIADDEKKQPTKDVAELSPEKQMELAIAEYKELILDQYRQPRNYASLDAKMRLSNIKKDEIIKLHKSLGLAKDQVAYEKAKATRIRVALELEKYYRKDFAIWEANREIEMKKNPTEEDRKRIIQPTPDDRGVLAAELSEATLIESLNTLLPPFKKWKGPANAAGPLRTL